MTILYTVTFPGFYLIWVKTQHKAHITDDNHCQQKHIDVNPSYPIQHTSEVPIIN